jgi:serine protease Do
MENGRQFRINIYTRGVGEQVALQIWRGERSLTVRVPVVERDADTDRLADLVGSQQSIAPLGIVALDLTAPVAELLPDLRSKTGAVIARVTPEAPYSQQGTLEPGDVIHAVNDRPIGNVDELKKVAAALKPGGAVVLQVEREGTLMLLAFRLERSR